MATIKEVAQRAHVSVGTVSNVLSGAVPVSEKLKERVMAVVKELDYHPNHVARSLKIRQTKMIGMVITDITNPFFPLLVRGAEDAAWKHHYMLITFNSDDQLEREKQVLTVLRTRRVDGILLVAATSDGDQPHIAGAIDAGIPIVCLDRKLKGLAADSVSVDNVGGTRQAVEHLIQAGHRRIGIVTGPMRVQVARDRLVGYKKALEDAAIPYDPALVRDGGFRAEAGFQASLEILDAEPRPTAVFTSNAMMALGLMRAIHQRELRCPEDVAAATFDDPSFAPLVRPPLTSVSQPSYELGFQGAELLIRRLQDPERRRHHVVLDTSLIVRESSGVGAAHSVE